MKSILLSEKGKKISNSILEAVAKFDLKMDDVNEIKNKADYNKYEISYSSDNKRDFLKENIVVETTYFIGSFPSEIKEVGSYIYEYYNSLNNHDLIKKYELNPFKIRVQSLERTFIDKVFAICDYHIRKSYDRNSRHIYDLFKIYPLLKFDENLKSLLNKVRILRSERTYCESAKNGIDINNMLKEIIKTNVFKNDYDKTTMRILNSNENISYEEAISVLNKIIDSNLFIESGSI